MAYSNEALKILEALREKHNVLLTGPPSCGKTHLLQEVADAFAATGTTSTPLAAPTTVMKPIAIPASIASTGPVIPGVPSPGRADRVVERIAFAANTRARDFTTAFVPAVGAGASGFRVATGALVRANARALGGAASLLIIDELNRGPAVQLFGDAIVAIEPDKRLDPDDRPTAQSWPLHILDDQGSTAPTYLSSHLYVLAAMNQADVSIEPVDVAFLRRFEPVSLEPRPDLVRSLLAAAGPGGLPDVPASPAQVVEAAVRAWEAVNERIALGRGGDFRLGHGIFLAPPTPPATLDEALQEAAGWWRRIAAHLNEVFFADLVGIGIAVNAGDDPRGYRIVETAYGLDQKQHLAAPLVSPATIYGLLRRVAGA